MANPMTVVSSNYLDPHPVLLIFYTFATLNSLSYDAFMAVDNVNGTNRTNMFQIVQDKLNNPGPLILADATGYNPILSFEKQRASWVVFRGGDGSYSNDIIFTAKRSSSSQQNTSIDVFLARNKNKKNDNCDFKIIGSSSQYDDSCTIYAGDGTNIIAQMYMDGAPINDTYNVTVYPNVDQAFVVALVVILHEINNDVQDDQLHFNGSAPKACSYACSFVFLLQLLFYFMLSAL